MPRSRRRSRSSRAAPAPDVPSDDEVDAFHADRDRVSLGTSADASDSDDGFESDDPIHPVLDVAADARDDSDDSDSDEDDDALPTSWGRGRSAYFAGDDESSDSDDEERSRAEEAEARRLQRARLAGMKASDFGDDSGSESDEGGASFASVLKGAKELRRRQDAGSASEAALTADDEVRLSKVLLDDGWSSSSSSDDDDDVDNVSPGRGAKKQSKSNAIKGKKAKEVIKGKKDTKSKKGKKGKKQSSTLKVEADDDLSDGERVERDSPELEGLLEELKERLAEVKTQVEPVLKRVKSGQLPTNEGVALLELKHQVLLSYCTNIAFYLMLKAEGLPVKDHPVVAQLVRLRVVLEKIRPLDDSMRRTINAAIASSDSASGHRPMLAADDASSNDDSDVEGDFARAAGGNNGDSNSDSDSDMDGDEWASSEDEGDVDFAQAKARAASAAKKSKSKKARLEDDDDEEEVAGKGRGTYQPPRFMATQFQDKSHSLQRKRERELEHQRRKAADSSLMKFVRDEYSELPEMEEFGLGEGGAVGGQAAEAQARADYEEEHFVRLPMTKREKKKRSNQEREVVKDMMRSGLESVEDFADVAVLADADAAAGRGSRGGSSAAGTGTGAGAGAGGQTAGQTAAASARAIARIVRDLQTGDGDGGAMGGDTDLPRTDRRRRGVRKDQEDFGPASADTTADHFGGGGLGGSDDESGGLAGRKRGLSDPVRGDEFYEEAREAAKRRKREREERRQAKKAASYAVEATVGDGEKRQISNTIAHNRGLTPHRKKEQRNPRVRQRKKFEKAVMRRKGAVRDMRTDTKDGGRYGGEATGINVSARKGRKLDR